MKHNKLKHIGHVMGIKYEIKFVRREENRKTSE